MKMRRVVSLIAILLFTQHISAVEYWGIERDSLLFDLSVTGYKVGVATLIENNSAYAGDVIIPEMRCEIIKDTVSSVRLDSVVSSAFRISRNTAAEAVRSGLVSVDHAECMKVDAKVEEGSILVLKGKGKAILEEIGNESKKNRTWIRIKRFV